ncbi:MAG TPA: hypothetical protein VGB75_01295 [Jatrophihabitans sp.]|jgi:hypothetical protein|uniref:hypothetical protein n=1 Tax=Jatrophihabitans sp. TaxID=1932789 RepID=UPI002F03A76F
MISRRGANHQPAAEWSRRKMLALLIGAGATGVLLVVGIVLAVVYAVAPVGHTAEQKTTSTSSSTGGGTGTSMRSGTAVDPRDALADKPMPTVDEDASHPGPVSTHDPGVPIILPAPTSIGPAKVPTGFPRTPQGAMAQLAAIDQTALQSSTLAGAREVIRAWALPGGPTSSWSGVRAMAEFFNAAGLSGGGNSRLAIVATPLMGLIKGSVGADFVLPCVDFEVDVTLQQTARGAAADCQRMVWTGARWMIGPGSEPAPAPSVWPGTDTALAVGYRDLRQEALR